jgi:hypothetical protein
MLSDDPHRQFYDSSDRHGEIRLPTVESVIRETGLPRHLEQLPSL